jgi:hypothetical protein
VSYYIVLAAHIEALSSFWNPGVDHESNPHAILICIKFFTSRKLKMGTDWNWNYMINKHLILGIIKI